MKKSSMGRKAPFKSSKKFEYSITYSFYDEESLEFGESFDSGYEVEPEVESISEILYTAWGKYGIYYPVSIGTWEATDVPEDRDFYEKGIRKYYFLHLKNEDGTEISEEDNDFVTHILSNGEYNREYFEEFALGGFLSGSTNEGLSWKLDRAKFNKGESYEIPMSRRKAMGGDADERELIQLRINNLKSLVNVMSDDEEIAEMQGVIARLERERDAMKYADGGQAGKYRVVLYKLDKYDNWEEFDRKEFDSLQKAMLFAKEKHNKGKGDLVEVFQGNRTLAMSSGDRFVKYAGGGDIEWNYWKIEKDDEIIYERTNVASPNIPNGKRISKEEYDYNVKKSYKTGGEVYFNGMSKKEILDATVVFDNNGDTLDRYTVFTPDGSVFGMSENASGFNQYIGEDDEVEQGEHLGRKLKSVPKNIQSAVLIRMIEEYKEGGFINKISDLPEDSKIRIDFVEVQVYEDSYDEGEGENTYNYSINVDGDSIPTKSLVEFLSNAIGTSDNPNDYMLDDGIVQTSELQDKDGNKPSKSEIESWKKGQTELFTANYLISISLIAEIEASDEVLSDLTGIETYKRGGSVKSKKPKKFKLKRKPKVARNMFEESVYEFGTGGRVDLFEDYENIPSNVQVVLDKYSDDFEEGNYSGLQKAQKEVEKEGYTFDFYLDGSAFGLRPKGVSLNELEGYDNEYGRGGYLYEVNKEGENLELRDRLFSAKNVKQLKERIIEKFGSLKGITASRRMRGGYYASVKLADGGGVSKAEDIKNEMYKAFESYLSNKNSDEKLVAKLKRILGKRKWFRYFKGDTGASDYSSVGRALSQRVNREGEKESMQISLDTKGLQIYDYNGDEMFKDGGGVGDVWIALSKTKNGLLLSERFHKQITHKELFDYYKKMGYEIIDSNIFKVTNKDILDVFKDAVSKYIKEKYNENVDWENTLLSYEVVGDRIIAQSCFVQTKNGNEYKVTPSDLVDKKYAKGGGVDDKKTHYEVSLKNDKHYGEVGVSLYGWQLDNRGRNYLTLQFKNGSVSTYGEGEVKVVNMMKDGGEISIWELRKGDKVKTRKGNIETIERKIESGYFTKESEYSHSFESLEFVSRPKRKYNDGGEVEEWMNDALKELRDYTNNDSLKIEDVYDDDYFLASDGSEEYLVFEDFDEAHEYAVEDVKSNLESNAEYFQRDWLMGHLEAGNYLRNVYDEWNMGYATDIMTEDDDKYPNRLIAEMVQWGIMDSDEAKGSDAEEIANDRMEDFVNALTDDQINQGNDGFDYYIDNFGEEEAFKMALENNLIDIEGASEDAVSVDGVAHFISSYDGEEILLDGGSYAYRIN